MSLGVYELHHECASLYNVLNLFFGKFILTGYRLVTWNVKVTAWT